MLLKNSVMHMRRIMLAACTATVFAASIHAQQSPDTSSQEFSSSTQTLAALDTDTSGPTAMPELTAAIKPAESNFFGIPGTGILRHPLDHFTGVAGGGFNAPVGNDKPFISWGGNILLGAGLRFNPHVSLLAEYEFRDNKLPGALAADAGADGGHAHIWSFTLNPVIDLFPKRTNDIYFTGGGGFYRKVTSFTDPEEVIYCDYFCEVGVTNVVVSHFSSNQGGMNIGMGISHKLAPDSHLRVFAEARYEWIDTPGIGELNGLGSTGLIPVNFGLRW